MCFLSQERSPREDPFDALDARIVPVANAALALGLEQSTISEVIAASGDEIYSIVVALED